MSTMFKNTSKLVLNNQYFIQLRFYPRWSHRRPVKVHMPEEFEEKDIQVHSPKTTENVFEKYGGFKPSWNRSKKFETNESESVGIKPKLKRETKPLVASYQKSKVISSVDMLQTVIDENGNFIYTKLPDNDARVGQILTEIKSKKTENKGLILLEGWRLIKDALISGCSLKYILFSQKQDVEHLKPFLPKIGAQLYKMPYKEIQMWSDLTTTPGIMGVFKTPKLEDFTPKNPLPITLICDNIREPGNLGTILRTSAAVGCDRVILTKGCVNVFDSKVLRSAIGAHFKLKIHTNVTWDEIEQLVPNSNFFIADNKLLSTDQSAQEVASVINEIPLVPYFATKFSSSSHLVLIIGGETVGISSESYTLTHKNKGIRLNIPLSNDVDSLNVGAALSVIVFEMKRQLLQ